MPRPTDRHLIGEQAECMFIFRGMEHGLIVSRPFGDACPYDFVVQRRHPRLRSRPPLWCIQVKSTNTRASDGMYHINVRRHSRAYLRSEVDFIAAWVIPENAWYIIPLAAVRYLTGIGLFSRRPHTRSKYEKYREAWHLLL